MYLALLKLVWLLRECVDWVRFHALRYFGHNLVQGGSGNKGARAGKLPLSDWRYPITVVLALFEAIVRMVWQVFRWLFFFNTRSIAEFFLSGVKLILVLSVLSVAGLYGYLSGEPDPQILADYQRLHQQHTATALLDKHGSLVGAMPNPQAQSALLGSLSVDLVPPVYWDILDYKSQRQLDFNYNDTGLSDLLFLRKEHYKGIATTDIVAAFNPFAKASDSLIAQLSQSLQSMGDAGSPCFSWFSDLCNTFSTVRLAKHAFPYLARNNGSEFKRWTAMHSQLRGQKDDFNGLRATAETVFNKLPENLSNAEQALLAVAQVNKQALLETDSWEVLLREADEVTHTLYTRNQKDLAAEIHDGLKLLSIPQVSDSILKLPHLRKRAEYVLGDFSELVNTRLSAEYAKTNDSRLVSDAQISLPVSDNLDFQKKLLSRLQDFQNRCVSCGFKQQLGEQIESGGAHIQVLVADDTGQIVRYLTRGSLQDRAVGALSTIPGAVLLASKGENTHSVFCNQTYRNLPSSVEGYPQGIVNCDTPDQPGHSVSFLKSTQIRASLPLFNELLKQGGADGLQKLYADFALKDLRTREGKPSHAEQLAYEMSYGVVQSTPFHMLEIIHQLSEILYGEGNPQAIQPISQFLVTDIQEGRRYLEFNEVPSIIRLMGNYLRTQQAKETMKLLLADDVNSPTGSLKALSKLRNIRFLLTKTGQSYTKQQALRDQWLLASVSIQGKRYSISAFVGSGAEDPKGLADQLNAAEMFYPIMAEIIDSLD